MPPSGAPDEIWLVGTQTLGWRAAGALAVLAGRVLDTEVEPDSPGPTTQVIVY